MKHCQKLCATLSQCKVHRGIFELQFCSKCSVPSKEEHGRLKGRKMIDRVLGRSPSQEERVRAAGVFFVLVLNRCGKWVDGVARRGRRGNPNSRRFDWQGAGRCPFMLFHNETYVVSSFLKLHHFMCILFVGIINWMPLFFLSFFLYFNDILCWQLSTTLKTASMNA